MRFVVRNRCRGFSYAGINAGIVPRCGSNLSNFLNAYVKISAQRLSGFNCSAIKLIHSRKMPIGVRDSRALPMKNVW